MSEIKVGGIGISGNRWLVIIPLLGTILGGLWGGFELWHRYQAMEAKIAKYVAPDLSGEMVLRPALLCANQPAVA